MTLTFFFLYWMTHALLCYLLLSFVMVVSGLLCRAGRPTGVLWPCGATRWQQYDMVSEVGFKPTPPFGDQNAHSLFLFLRMFTNTCTVSGKILNQIGDVFTVARPGRLQFVWQQLWYVVIKDWTLINLQSYQIYRVNIIFILYLHYQFRKGVTWLALITLPLRGDLEYVYLVSESKLYN